MRYSRRNRDRYEPGPLPLPADGGLATTTKIRSQSIAGSYNLTLTPSMANEFRFGWTNFPTSFDIPYDKALFADFGIKGIPKTNFDISNNHGLTRFTPGGYAELGSRSFWPNTNNLRSFQFNETLFKTLGTHTIRIGGELKRQNVFRNSARISYTNEVGWKSLRYSSWA